jgi:hypothetical protein
MPSLSNLKAGHRYLFYKQYDQNPIIQFRATFIDIIDGTTLRVSSHTEHLDSLMVTIPTNWIINVETLDEITKKQMVLPEDILLLIDEYM